MRPAPRVAPRPGAPASRTAAGPGRPGAAPARVGTPSWVEDLHPRDAAGHFIAKLGDDAPSILADRRDAAAAIHRRLVRAGAARPVVARAAERARKLRVLASRARRLAGAAPARHAAPDLDHKADSAAAARWGAREWRGWAKRLDRNEDAAVRIYQSGDYRAINQGLRGHDVAAHTSALSAGDRSNVVALMDSALAKSRVPEEVRVYRAVSDFRAVHGVSDPARLVGRTFRDDGFVSTAASSKSTDTFAFGPRPLRYEIDVPAGSRGAFLSAATGYARSETEVLLPRGSRFRVVGHRVEAGVDVLSVRHVGEASPADPHPHKPTFLDRILGRKSLDGDDGDDGGTPPERRGD